MLYIVMQGTSRLLSTPAGSTSVDSMRAQFNSCVEESSECPGLLLLHATVPIAREALLALLICTGRDSSMHGSLRNELIPLRANSALPVAGMSTEEFARRNAQQQGQEGSLWGTLVELRRLCLGVATGATARHSPGTPGPFLEALANQASGAPHKIGHAMRAVVAKLQAERERVLHILTALEHLQCAAFMQAWHLIG